MIYEAESVAPCLVKLLPQKTGSELPYLLLFVGGLHSNHSTSDKYITFNLVIYTLPNINTSYFSVYSNKLYIFSFF